MLLFFTAFPLSAMFTVPVLVSRYLKNVFVLSILRPTAIAFAQLLAKSQSEQRVKQFRNQIFHPIGLYLLVVGREFENEVSRICQAPSYRASSVAQRYKQLQKKSDQQTRIWNTLYGIAYKLYMCCTCVQHTAYTRQQNQHFSTTTNIVCRIE